MGFFDGQSSSPFQAAPFQSGRPHSKLRVALVHFVLVLLAATLGVESICVDGHAAATSSQDAQDELAQLRSLVLRGRYGEAIERYERLQSAQPVEAALGLANCHVATGDRGQALTLLRAALLDHPAETQLTAQLAQLEYDSGQHDAARQYVDQTLAHAPNNLQARWLDAELLRTSGELDKAAAAYQWIVERYNRAQRQLTQPEQLHFVALAAAQYARWRRLHDQFGFLINTLYPDVILLENNYWPAHLEKARLYIEKFNTAEASKALVAALKINPNASEIHAARAALALQTYDFETALPALERALEINPQCAEAHRLMADVELANFRTAEAIRRLEQALAINPRDDATLGRLAAIYLIGQGMEKQHARQRFDEIVADVVAVNPIAGEFHFVLAETLANFRRWPQARDFYQRAADEMPQLIGPRAALGMMHMRLGQEEAAQKELAAAFEEDPFNVRVKNMLEVLDVLDSYAELGTEHFLFKHDHQHDAVFAHYLAEFMEDIYPELCRDFNFEPPERSLFEVFNQAKNTSGHGWFSARMIGLPYVGTVGACAGQMVAITSPDAMNSKFNWARVARHEFVHVLNLQQTNFNVPHWFTEGLAVEAEGYPRSELWDQLLVSRVPQGEIFNLEDINFGFIRPASQLEWHLAYCQSELYVQFMREEFSPEGPAAMLQAYAENMTTPEAIAHCFEVSLEEFERRYTAYLERLIQTLPPDLKPPGEERSFAEIDRAARADATNPDALAELAQAYLLRQEYPNARKFAEAARRLDEAHQQATYVLARLAVVTGERDEARELLEAAINPADPFPAGIQLLSGLRCLQGDFAAAEELVLAAQVAQPGNPQWTEDLAAIYLRSGDDAKLAGQLEKLAEADADQFNYRKKLALIAQAEGDHRAAARWAREAIWIDVMDTDVHEVLAEAALQLGEYPLATGEYRTLIQLQPDQRRWPLALARAYLAADETANARGVLKQMLLDFPNDQEARNLLEEIGQAAVHAPR